MTVEDMFADVAVRHKIFTYQIPDNLKQEIQKGSGVIVPVRDRKEMGYVIELKEETAKQNLKSVIEVLYPSPLITAHLFKLGLWMADYYVASASEAFDAIVPLFTREKRYLRPVNFPPPPLAQKQRLLYKHLLTRLYGINKEEIPSASALRTLKQKNIIETSPKPDFQPIPSLTAGRQVLKDAHQPLTNKVFLVTASQDKRMEVYIQAMKKVLTLKMGCIFLVPRIVLIPSVLGRLKGEFTDNIAVLHSELPRQKREEEWLKLEMGLCEIAIGTRSCVFAPFKNLGLIIIDEEQSPDYKDKQKPRYSARDVAIMRAKEQKCYCLLGSDTPSIESYYNAETGKYKLIKVEEKRTYPKVSAIDMKKEKDYLLSEKLKNKIKTSLEKREKILLLLNRKGFSAISCRNCGYTPVCPRCDTILRYHKVVSSKQYGVSSEDHQLSTINHLMCHLCGYNEPVKTRCKNCNSTGIFYPRPGTQKLEAKLKILFPKTSIIRMDLDTIKTERIKDKKFKGENIGIVLGTQIIRREQQLEDVKLMSIISPDIGLSIPDFRSSETTFSLIMSFINRINPEGEVVIQTYNPDNYMIQALIHTSFETFYQQEKQRRKELNYPPFSHLTRILVEGNKVDTTLGKVEQELNEKNINYLGPVSCPMQKKKGKLRYHFLIKSEKIDPSLLKQIADTIKSVTIDIDPVELM